MLTCLKLLLLLSYVYGFLSKAEKIPEQVLFASVAW